MPIKLIPPGRFKAILISEELVKVGFSEPFIQLTYQVEDKEAEVKCKFRVSLHGDVLPEEAK